MVIESGWSESLDRLREEARLWLAGGNATTVIVICWRSVANTDQVEGEIEQYVLDGNGSPVLRQTDIVSLETPEQGHIQSIRLTRWMVLGSTISPDRDPDDPFDLRIDDLRWAAARALGFMDLSTCFIIGAFDLKRTAAFMLS